MASLDASRIRGWNPGRRLGQSLTLIAFQRALLYRQPEIHRSDQGIQYAALVYVRLLWQVNNQISMAEVGAAWQNGYAERLIRTIKEVDLSEYQDYNDARRQLGRFLDEVYTHKRMHSSLGYLTIAEVEDQWRRDQGIGSDDHQETVQKCPVSWVQFYLHMIYSNSEGAALQFQLKQHTIRGESYQRNIRRESPFT